MTGVEYRVLGPLQVLDGEREVDLGGHKQRAVLALLLLGGGRVVSADELVDRLWDSEPPPGAANTLQGYISNLRRALEPDRPRSTPPQLLVTQAPGYVLRVGDGELDADRFSALAQAGREALAADRPEQARAALDEALRLWRGDPLADFTYDGFARQEIARLTELRLGALEDRIDADLALSRHGALAAELPALVAEHPLRERLRGQLIVALYRSNRQADALEAYRDARERLADELGIDPSPWLQSLEEAVLRQDPALDPRPLAIAATTPPASSAGFVGRTAELAVLHRALQAAAAGTGRLVLVGGEPGIGKTRLLEELLDAATDPLVLWGRTFQADDAPAYWCWTQVLDDAAQQLGRDELVALANADAARLAPLSPLLAAEHDATADTANPFALHLAATGFLARLAERRPLVIVLDDLHWATPHSLRLLEFLAANLRRLRILVLASFRDTEPDSPLGDTLAKLSREPVTERLTLSGLRPEDVAAYVHEVVGTVPDDGLAAAIHERTDGNPFFVAELVRVLSLEGRLDRAAVEDVPPSIRDVIRLRLENLPRTAMEVLAVAACARDMFEPAVIGVVLDMPAERVRQVLELASAHRLLIEAPRVGSYRFAHGLIRDTLYADLTAMRRAELHREIALALEVVPPHLTGLRPIDLAHHFCAGAPAGDADRGVAAARDAAEDALGRLAFEEAAALYAQALAVADTYLTDDLGTRCDILVALGTAVKKTGDLTAARDALERAVELARRLGDPVRLGRAVLEFGGGFWGWWRAFGGVDRTVTAHLEEALAGLDEDEPALRAALASRLAVELYFSDSRERRDELTGQAIALAREVDDPGLLATALASRHAALWEPWNLTERLALAEELVAVSQRQPAQHALARHFRMMDRLEAGDLAGVEEDLAVCEQLDARLGEHGFAVQLQWFRAVKAFIHGDFADAERLAADAYRENRRANPLDARLSFGSFLTLLRREQGRLAEIEPHTQSRVGEHPGVAFAWSTALALTLASLGRLDEARLVFESVAENDFPRLPDGLLQPLLLAELAEVCALLDDRVRAASVLERLERCEGAVTLLGTGHLCWGATAHWRGRLLSTLGRTAEAVAAYEEALTVNQAIGARPFAARTQYHLAELLSERSATRERSLELVSAAMATANELGMSMLAQRCVALMARVPQPA